MGYGRAVGLWAFQGDVAIDTVDAFALGLNSGRAFTTGHLGNTGKRIADGGNGTGNIADPLTGQILELAGLENVTGLLVNFFELQLGNAFLGFSGNGVGDFVSHGVQFLKRRGK